MKRRRNYYLDPRIEGERYKLWAAYIRLGLPRDAERVAKCPATLKEWRDRTRRPCHDRLCPLCTWRAGLRNFYRLDKYLQHARNPWFITLKVPPQTYGVRHLLDAWAKIRRCKWFKENVYGGCRFIELDEMVRGTGALTPHLHLILDINLDMWGRGGISLLEFENLLLAEWTRLLPFANSGRYIACNQIDNTDADNRKRILKYGFKAPKRVRDNHLMILTFWEELRGVHRCAPFGNWVKKRAAKRDTTVYYYKNGDTPEPAPAAPTGPPEDEPAPPRPKWVEGWQELDQKLRE